MAVDGRIGDAVFHRGHVERSDFSPERNDGRGDVFPMFAAVARELDQPVIGADPDLVGVARRGCDRRNDAIAAGLRRLARDIAVAILCVGDFARKIAADFVPRPALVLRAEQDIAAEIERGGPRFRRHQRRHPHVAIFGERGTDAVILFRPRRHVGDLSGVSHPIW